MPAILLSPSPPLRSFAQLTPADFDPEWPGLSSSYVEGFLGRELVPLLYRVEHDMMDYGTHWRWVHGHQLYTVAGLLLLVEELRKIGCSGPALQLAMHARHSSAYFRASRQCDGASAAAEAARRCGETESDEAA